MRFAIPPITRPIYLSAYAPQLVDATGQSLVVQVWVNPPRQMLLDHDAAIERLNAARDQLDKLVAEMKAWAAERAATDPPPDSDAPVPSGYNAALTEVQQVTETLLAWCAKIWSMHADISTHWSVEDVQALMENDTDPALYGWLKRRTLAAIQAHRIDTEKK